MHGVGWLPCLPERPGVWAAVVGFGPAYDRRGRWELACGRRRGNAVRIRKLARRMFRQPRGYGVGERTPRRLFIFISFFLSILCMQVLKRFFPSLRGSNWPHHIVFILLYIGFGASMYLGWRLWVQRKERFRALVQSARGDICPVCHYPMRVAVGERCPECGTLMDMYRIYKWRLWWRGW
jgi:hypothetical protein